MSVSSPIITSSISLQWPSLTSSGWSKVEVISPPGGWGGEREITGKVKMYSNKSINVCVCVRACTCDQGEAFHSTEVGVLDGHDSSLSEQLLRVVVDQLPAEEEEALKRRGRPLLDTWLQHGCVCVCTC